GRVPLGPVQIPEQLPEPLSEWASPVDPGRFFDVAVVGREHDDGVQLVVGHELDNGVDLRHEVAVLGDLVGAHVGGGGAGDPWGKVDDGFDVDGVVDHVLAALVGVGVVVDGELAGVHAVVHCVLRGRGATRRPGGRSG